MTYHREDWGAWQAGDVMAIILVNAACLLGEEAVSDQLCLELEAVSSQVC
jgi:hypothetical protein